LQIQVLTETFNLGVFTLSQDEVIFKTFADSFLHFVPSCKALGLGLVISLTLPVAKATDRPGEISRAMYKRAMMMDKCGASLSSTSARSVPKSVTPHSLAKVILEDRMTEHQLANNDGLIWQTFSLHRGRQKTLSFDGLVVGKGTWDPPQGYFPNNDIWLFAISDDSPYPQITRTQSFYPVASFFLMIPGKESTFAQYESEMLSLKQRADSGDKQAIGNLKLFSKNLENTLSSLLLPSKELEIINDQLKVPLRSGNANPSGAHSLFLSSRYPFGVQASSGDFYYAFNISFVSQRRPHPSRRSDILPVLEKAIKGIYSHIGVQP